MSAAEYKSWLIETNPGTRALGPIMDQGDAVEVFETYIGRRGKHPVKLLEFSCDAELQARFSFATLSAVEGAVKGGFGVMTTLRELDVYGVEVSLDPGALPSP